MVSWKYGEISLFSNCALVIGISVVGCWVSVGSVDRLLELSEAPGGLRFWIASMLNGLLDCWWVGLFGSFSFLIFGGFGVNTYLPTYLLARGRTCEAGFKFCMALLLDIKFLFTCGK